MFSLKNYIQCLYIIYHIIIYVWYIYIHITSFILRQSSGVRTYFLLVFRPKFIASKNPKGNVVLSSPISIGPNLHLVKQPYHHYNEKLLLGYAVNVSRATCHVHGWKFNTKHNASWKYQFKKSSYDYSKKRFFVNISPLFICKPRVL